MQPVIDGSTQGNCHFLAVGHSHNALGKRQGLGDNDLYAAFADNLVVVNHLSSNGSSLTVRNKNTILNGAHPLFL